MSQTQPIARNPQIPNGPGDLRSRFPSQPNPYDIPATPHPPLRQYKPGPPSTAVPPTLNPFVPARPVPGIPKTPGGNYVGRGWQPPYTQNLPRVQGYSPIPPHAKRWVNPALQRGTSIPATGFRWNITPKSRPPLPAMPRSPGINPRWPRWARIPPSGKILLGVSALGHIGLRMLKPSPADWLFGIVPDAMEAARPWVWEKLGIKVPGSGDIPSATTPQSLPLGGHIYYVVAGTETPSSNIYGPTNTAINFYVENPFIRWEPGFVSHLTPMPGSIRVVVLLPNGGIERTGQQSESKIQDIRIRPYLPNGTLGPPQPLTSTSAPTPATAPTANPLSPTNGVQPGTPPYSGMPAASRGQRPATDPRSYRPDIQAIPQTAPQPRVQTQAEPKPDQAATNCRFTPASQAERDALNDKIRDLNEEIRRILRENEDLRGQLAAANQATFMQVPYVVENSEGKRVKQFYPITLKGLVDTTSEASLSNQTADWAMQQGDKTERIYQILGGDSTWGNDPTPQAQVNPDAQLRAQPVIDEAGLGRMLDIRNLPQLFTATQAATYQRQGLQQFPLTAQVPGLNQAGLLDDVTTPQVFRTSTDVQVTTSSKGFAIVKGVNEVITRTKQTIEWLKIDRILNLLNFATTLHNALMLSNALGQTLMGIIDNILATFGFALKDATGNTIGVGDLIGGTIENVIKAAIGTDNYTKLKKDWAKANRIYQAGMNIIYSVQSIGYSILGALEIVGKWVAWIGNALKRFGALTEKAYPWMNPSPDFQNPVFTKIEAAQEFAEALEVVTAESRSVTETVTELGNQKKALDKELEDGKDTRNLPDNKEQKENQDKQRTASQAPIIPKFDLVRPEPEG